MRARLLVIGIALSCSNGPAPLTTWSDDPAERLRECGSERLAEMRDLCHLNAARGLGEQADVDGVGRACEQISSPKWREECWFLGAEGLGLAGELGAAVKGCRRTGDNEASCFDHIGALAPVPEPLGPSSSADVLTAGLHALAEEVALGTDGMPQIWRVRVRRVVVGSIARAALLGTGQVAPAAASVEHWSAPLLRTGAALEAARLLAEESSSVDPADIVAVLNGARPPLSGDPVSLLEIRGCTPHTPTLDNPRSLVPVWGNRWRRVDPDPAADLAVAALEAAYWTGSLDAEATAAFAREPHSTVATTAIELLHQRASKDPKARQQLEELAASHPNPSFRAQAASTTSVVGGWVDCVGLVPGEGVDDHIWAFDEQHDAPLHPHVEGQDMHPPGAAPDQGRDARPHNVPQGAPRQP